MSEKLKNFTQSLPGQHSELLVTCGSAVAQSVPGPLSPLQRTAVDCVYKDVNTNTNTNAIVCKCVKIQIQMQMQLHANV